MSTVRTGAGTWCIVDWGADCANYVYEDAANSVHGPHEGMPLKKFQDYDNFTPIFPNSYGYEFSNVDGFFTPQLAGFVFALQISVDKLAGSITFANITSLLGNQFQQLEDRNLGFNYPDRKFSFFYPVERE